MKDLAVLIPVYNDAAALAETLDSIREPDWAFTVFVVDDGSREPLRIDTDRHPFPIRIIRQDPNGGIVRALNLGLEAIRQEGFRYVARLDAADRNRAGRLALQYRHLESRPDLAMVGSNVVFRDEDTGEPLFTTNLPLSQRDTRRWIVFRNCFIHPAVMFRTRILDETGCYDPTYPHIEDYVLFSRIVERFDAENLEPPLVDCLVRRGGISLANERRQLLSGLRFRLASPRPLDPLWYAFLLKRLSYLAIPPSVRLALKSRLGFARRGAEPPAPESAAARV